MVAVWTGAITFGLVTIGCTLHRATRDRSVSFHQIHAGCGARIRYRKFCEAENREVPLSEIASAYDYAGRLVQLTDTDLDKLPLTSARRLEVRQFVPTKQIDPVAIGRAYYIQPEQIAERADVLLRDVLAETDRAALGTLALRGRERLALLRAEGGLLVAHCASLVSDRTRVVAGRLRTCPAGWVWLRCRRSRPDCGNLPARGCRRRPAPSGDRGRIDRLH